MLLLIYQAEYFILSYEKQMSFLLKRAGYYRNSLEVE